MYFYQYSDKLDYIEDSFLRDLSIVYILPNAAIYTKYYRLKFKNHVVFTEVL